MIFHPFCSTEIAFLRSDELQNKLLSEQRNVVLILTDTGENRWNLSDFVLNLRNYSKSLVRISHVATNPSAEDIHDALERIGTSSIDVIIAIGGGSAIDLAKGIVAFYSPRRILSSDEILSSIQNKSYLNCTGIDIIAVPTTAGTGSEVTQWATVWDMDNKNKLSIDSPQLKPKAAYLVSEFTVSLTKMLSLSTGLDALAHAMEAYWSKYTSPLVQDIALRAISIIVENLKLVLDNPSDLFLRERLMRASLLAGLSFSQTRTTACHAISYPMTMYYGVPHGIAVALTLSGVAELNKGHFPNDGDLYLVFSKYGGIRKWMDYVSEDILDLHCESVGIKNIALIAEKAGGNGRMANNPVDIDVKSIIEMLTNDGV